MIITISCVWDFGTDEQKDRFFRELQARFPQHVFYWEIVSELPDNANLGYRGAPDELDGPLCEVISKHFCSLA